MRILLFAYHSPYLLIGGDRFRIYNFLRRVASRQNLSLAAFLTLLTRLSSYPTCTEVVREWRALSSEVNALAANGECKADAERSLDAVSCQPLKVY